MCGINWTIWPTPEPWVGKISEKILPSKMGHHHPMKLKRGWQEGRNLRLFYLQGQKIFPRKAIGGRAFMRIKETGHQLEIEEQEKRMTFRGKFIELPRNNRHELFNPYRQRIGRALKAFRPNSNLPYKWHKNFFKIPLVEHFQHRKMLSLRKSRLWRCEWNSVKAQFIFNSTNIYWASTMCQTL